MRVVSLSLRDFRGYSSAHVSLADGLTVITGPNGAGKTNLLEGLYFGCVGRSCRTTNERELVRFGAASTRVEVVAAGEDGDHELAVGLAPGEPKRMKVDGVAVERIVDLQQRPLVSVFLPDRLELVKGPPALRRAHLDQFVSALWPARAATRKAYAQALAQRNALISRLRTGAGSRTSLAAWDGRLAALGIELMHDRRQAAERIASPFARLAAELGLGESSEVEYRPRSRASAPGELGAELAERVESDLKRGFTGHGPHRDELALRREGRELRAYGSQGQQRLGLLALLLAEREVLADARGTPPLILLDDVMSELDATRREALVELLRTDEGQSLITTTDLDHVPGARSGEVARIAIAGGQVLTDAVAA